MGAALIVLRSLFNDRNEHAFLAIAEGKEILNEVTVGQSPRKSGVRVEEILCHGSSRTNGLLLLGPLLEMTTGPTCHRSS